MANARSRLRSLADDLRGPTGHLAFSDLAADGVKLGDALQTLHEWLMAADDWLAAHPDVSDYRAREDRWLARVQQYQAGMDLLAELLEALKQERPEPEQATLAGLAAETRHRPHWEA